MNKYYPAVFQKEVDGGYSISFPDLPEALTCGETMENAIEMATECLELCLVGRIEDNEVIPEANFEDIELNKDEFIVGIGFNKSLITNL